MKTPRHTAGGAASARTRTFVRRLTLFLLAVAFAVFAASALAGSHAAMGSFIINDSIPPNSQGPVFSNPVGNETRSKCNVSANSRVFPGGPFHYKVYTFKGLAGWWAGGIGSGDQICVNVSLLVNSGSATAALHVDAFNPADPDKFAGSVGGLGAGQAGDFSWNVSTLAPPRQFQVVVYETIPNGGASYTLLVEGTSIIMSSGGPTAAASLQSFRASSAPKGVLVRWKTRSEHDALGFNVYRGGLKKVRLTRSMVHASGNGRGHTYSYIDRTARKGKTGPYYLEVVHRNGSKIMFGPALRTAR